MAAPTSVADLIELVNQSLPLDPARLDGYVAKLRKDAALPGRPADLAALLVRDGFLTPFQADHLMRGRRPKFLIGKYLILDRIGAGGMGAVYLCEHLQLERQVALKVLPADQADDPAALGRFYREAQAVAALNHPNIVRAYDVDVEGRTYFLVMEYVDGVNLQELTTKRGRLDPVRAAHYVRQAAEGLQHAHQAGLVHRDIKPANLLLSRTGVLKVLDLGLARFFHEDADSITKEHNNQSILGTADYLAPEQGRDSHAVDIRADIYSLGATFYFLLVGRAPFADGTLNQKLIWHQMKAPTPVRKLRPEAPEAMAAVLERMMAKDAARRYQTPAEVVAALAPWTRTALPPPAAAEMPPVRKAARAGKPWRKTAGSAGSTVVQRATRPTALHAPAAVAKRRPSRPRRRSSRTSNSPPAAPPAAVPLHRTRRPPSSDRATTIGRTCSTTIRRRLAFVSLLRGPPRRQTPRLQASDVPMAFRGGGGGPGAAGRRRLGGDRLRPGRVETSRPGAGRLRPRGDRGPARPRQPAGGGQGAGRHRIDVARPSWPVDRLPDRARHRPLVQREKHDRGRDGRGQRHPLHRRQPETGAGLLLPGARAARTRRIRGVQLRLGPAGLFPGVHACRDGAQQRRRGGG